MADSLEKDKRTFETRLQYIREIAMHPYSKNEIMAKCINHKLKISYSNYIHELNKSFENIVGLDPEEIIKNLK